MSYKIKRQNKHYYSERMQRDADEYYRKRGKRVPVKKEARIIFEGSLSLPEKIHTRGSLVKYKGKEYIVKKGSHKGIIVEELRSGEIGKKELAKPLFIPEKEVEKNVEYSPHIFYL